MMAVVVVVGWGSDICVQFGNWQSGECIGVGGSGGVCYDGGGGGVGVGGVTFVCSLETVRAWNALVLVVVAVCVMMAVVVVVWEGSDICVQFGN